MATRQVGHLLVGGGIASASAAAALRELGAEGSILLVGRELDAPYHRPPISKDYLVGASARADALVHPEGWWAEHDVELMSRVSVLDVDLGERTAKLSNREEVGFETALIATGAMVRRLSVEGAALEGIHYLRTLGNADALRRDAEEAERVVMVGGSYIGCEVAASLTSLGKQCTIVMQEEFTLQRAFGPVVGRHFQSVLTERGIEVVGEDEVERFTNAEGASEHGRVRRVHLRSGRELACDAVVAGVGAIPDVMLARKIGLEIGPLGGVSCDPGLLTSAPGVFAAGDMAEYDSPLHGGAMRIEHEDVAFQQGRTAACNMLGLDRPHEVVPYFFSDLADWASIEYVGPARDWDAEITRGALQDGSFSHFYLRDGRVVGALAVERPQDLEQARRLLASRAPVHGREAELADPHSDLAAIGADG